MSYSPYAHTTATSARLGLIKLGTGVSGNTDGSLVTTSVPSITSGQVTTALGILHIIVLTLAVILLVLTQVL